MAKRNNGKAVAENESPPETDGDENSDFAADVIGENAPEGFRRVNPIDGDRLYFKPTEGASLRGVLLGRFQRIEGEGSDEEKFYYQIRASMECDAVTSGDGEVTTAKVGAIVNVDERAGLRDLLPLSLKTKPQEVFIRSIEKVKVRKDAKRSFWRWDVYAKDASTATLAKVRAAVKNEEPDFGAP